MDSMFPKMERVAMRHVLHDVRAGAPPLSDSVGKQSEVWRKQDDVGRLAGNIRAAVDGKPNIGGMDGGRVVDAVPYSRRYDLGGEGRARSGSSCLATCV
jgi:hypothetical protein